MKKLAVLLAIILVPVLAMAQVSTIDKLIDKYSGQDGVTVVNISPELFQIMSGLNIEDVADVDFPLDKLTAVKVLAIDSKEVLQGADFYAEVTEDLNTSEYAEVISVKDGDEDVKMWLKADGNQIKEFLLVVSSPDEGVVVYIAGDFNMSDIEGLAESFGGIEDLEALKNL
jgi:hypothetical protein